MPAPNTAEAQAIVDAQVDKMIGSIKTGGRKAALADLDSRLPAFMDKLKLAVKDKDIEAIYWIQIEIVTMFHIYGVQSHISPQLAIELLKGAREYKKDFSLKIDTGDAAEDEAMMRALRDASLIKARTMKKTL